MQAESKKILRKLKTVRGQVDGLIRMVEDDRYCIDISNQLMASIAILKNINKEVLHAHLEHCVTSAMMGNDPQEQKEKVEEIIQVMDKLSK